MFRSLLLLIAAGAFIAPALLIGSRMELRSIWQRGLLWVAWGHFISSATILTLLPPAELGSGLCLYPLLTGTTLVACSPLTLWLLPGGAGTLGGTCYLLYAANSLLWSIPVVGLCYLIRRCQERKAESHRLRVEEAMARILEDGVVAIPEGARTPSRRWGSRPGRKVDLRGLRGPRNTPCHGMRWQ